MSFSGVRSSNKSKFSTENSIEIFPDVHSKMKGSLLHRRLCHENSKAGMSDDIYINEEPLRGTTNSIFHPEFKVKSPFIDSLKTTNLVVDCSLNSGQQGAAHDYMQSKGTINMFPCEIGNTSSGEPTGRVAVDVTGTVTIYNRKVNSAVATQPPLHALLALIGNNLNNRILFSRRKTRHKQRFNISNFTINMQPMRLKLVKPSPENVHELARDSVISARRFPGVSYRTSIIDKDDNGVTRERVIKSGLTIVVVKNSRNVIVTGPPQSRNRLSFLLNKSFQYEPLREVSGIDKVSETTE